MRIAFLFCIFLCACSVKTEVSKKNNIQPKVISFSEIDSDKDGTISKEEFKNHRKTKETKRSFVDPSVDYRTPLMGFLVVLLLIFSCCSLHYILTFINNASIWLKGKIKRK